MKKRYKPGYGWRHVSGSVYERIDLTRIHLLGMCRLPDGSWISGNKWPEAMVMERMVRINGGNRIRGLMAWANILIATRIEP